MRGHLAARIDPLNLNNAKVEDAKTKIIRSVTVQEADMDTVFQLPVTTWIGGKVLTFGKLIFNPFKAFKVMGFL